nr:ribonuclease H-like domain-containing protein [Tanacetum cinerariifolium]
PRITANVDGTSTSIISSLVTTKEKAQKKNDVKARSMLLMALPNEHLLTFSQYKDAKTLFESIQARFGGNDATKKTQKTLLKQMYKNFNAPSTESFDFIFNRLQKIVSQLAILGENISQEDLNMKFLRNLEQIHDDDLEEMDLKWQLALLSMRARRECKSPRSQESRPRNQNNSRKTVIMEDTSSKVMMVIDGAGFNWSYMADDEVPTNMALMDFLDSELNKSEFDLATYKRGLASVEEQLVFYKKSEVRILQKSLEKSQNPDKNGHENGKSTQEPGIIKKSQPKSTLVNSQNDKNPQNTKTALNVKSIFTKNPK